MKSNQLPPKSGFDAEVPAQTVPVATWKSEKRYSGWVAGRLVRVDRQAGITDGEASAQAATGEGPLHSEGNWGLEADGERLALAGFHSDLICGLDAGFEQVLDGDIARTGAAKGDDDSSLVGAWVAVQMRNNVAEAVRVLTPSRRSGARVTHAQVKGLKHMMAFRRDVHAFFQDAGFLEVTTPTLVPSPGLEPFLDPFQTEYRAGKEIRTLYLPTSPEFHLKKALAAGLTRIYEIKTCFRNGEVSPHHQPEFTMLEWYRALAPLSQLITDIQNLLSHLVPEAPVLKTMTMSQLWLEAANLNLTSQTSEAELRAWCKTHNVDTAVDDDWNDLFFRLMIELIEPYLNTQGAVVVTDFPASQSALARIQPNGFAARFEFYWNGLEIANAFDELTDPDQQRARFALDQQKKRALGKEIVPIDEELLRALEFGMPPTSGIALGLDRLFMAIHRYKTIESTRLFPFRRRDEESV